ncbi:hypothetical protein psal_cds_329 [Pandoravirus salinus]|uniref:Uncharacterized protein n=1 Tax=Pandoravirus salinus TaxID=1349410 RepID=S4W1H3_9VIRU|nr:hypothetical protein psal_cds_329 [Pandoravirus salinus]AGO83960.1 hypothetical protein psal_cds_329 [Pandoravirus salinus]
MSDDARPCDDASVGPLTLLVATLALLALARALAGALARIYARYANGPERRPVSRPATAYHFSIGIDSLGDLAVGGWSVRVAAGHPALGAVRKTVVPLCDAREDDRARDPLAESADAISGDTGDDNDGTKAYRAASGAPADEPLVKTVGFLGARGVGKTFCINGLYGLTLPCGPLHSTCALGVVYPTAPGKPVIVDTAGDGAPALAGDATAAHGCRLTEALVQELALCCADQIVLVVGAMTAADQARISSLAERMARRGQRQLFVLHNLRHAGDPRECDRLWADQVLAPYGAVGHLEHRGDQRLAHFVVTAKGGVHVYHMRLARAGTPAGDLINANTYAVLRARLDAFGVARPFDPCALVDRSLGDALPRLVDDFAGVQWQPEGALAGDVFADVVCDHDDSGGGGGDLVARIQCRTCGAGATPTAPLRLRPATWIAADTWGTDVGDTLDGSDFDVPIKLRDAGTCVLVRIDVPGVDPASLTVTSLVGPRGQYAEVRGLRLSAPDGDGGDGETVASRGRCDNGDNGGDHGNDGGGQRKHARGDPETDGCCPAPRARDKKRGGALRSAVYPTERHGRLCVRVDMPPGSCVDASTIDCTHGVLSFKIRRQTEPIALAVQKGASPASLSA